MHWSQRNKPELFSSDRHKKNVTRPSEGSKPNLPFFCFTIFYFFFLFAFVLFIIVFNWTNDKLRIVNIVCMVFFPGIQCATIQQSVAGSNFSYIVYVYIVYVCI